MHLSMCFGGILDDMESAAAGDVEDAVHIGRQAVDVDRHDRPGAGCERLLDALRVEAPGDRIGIHEHGPGACANDRRRAGDDRERRYDHLVARADAQCRHRSLQRR